MGKKVTRGRKPGQKVKPARCKACGTLKVSVGSPGQIGCHYRCLNLTCPRKGQLPWVIPRMTRPGPRELMLDGDEDNPGMENGVRILEDRSGEQ